MGLWKRLLGRGLGRPDGTGLSAAGTQPTGGEARQMSAAAMKRLWEKAKGLLWSESPGDLRKAVEIYSELLTLVDEESAEFDVCALLRNRAIAYRHLGDYEAALADLARELSVARRRGDHLREMECRRVTEKTREMQRNDEIQRGGGEKAAKLDAMRAEEGKLWGGGADQQPAFAGLFADLESGDPDVRAEAARLLADNPVAVRELISIYQLCVSSDPHRAGLAGRVLGRQAARGSDDMVSAEIGQVMYGIAASFLPCPCFHCGSLNKGIPAPPAGPMVPYYHQGDGQGAYAVPVLCDKCSREFFVVWDQDPR